MRVLVILLVSMAFHALPADAQPSRGPSHPCDNHVSWFAEVTLWAGKSNSNSAGHGSRTEYGLRNSAAAVFAPCARLSYSAGLSFVGYFGVIDQRGGTTILDDSAIGGLMLGPELRVDLALNRAWRLGVVAGLDWGGSWSHPRDYHDDATEIAERIGLRARYASFTFGVDLVHSNGANNLCQCGGPFGTPESNTALMVGIGNRGRPPWATLAVEGLAVIVFAAATERSD
jgi:hypothetical protein